MVGGGNVLPGLLGSGIGLGDGGIKYPSNVPGDGVGMVNGSGLGFGALVGGGRVLPGLFGSGGLVGGTRVFPGLLGSGAPVGTGATVGLVGGTTGQTGTLQQESRGSVVITQLGLGGGGAAHLELEWNKQEN